MKWVSRETAQRVMTALGNDAIPHSSFKAYYIMSSHHPLVREMEKQFKIEHGMTLYHGCPLGDTQRTQVELSLLNENALQMVMKLCKERENKVERQTDGT